MFRDDRLRNIFGVFHIETSGSIQVATCGTVSQSTSTTSGWATTVGRGEIRADRAILRLRRGPASPDSQHRGNFTMAHHRIGTSDWVMMFYADQ